MPAADECNFGNIADSVRQSCELLECSHLYTIFIVLQYSVMLSVQICNGTSLLLLDLETMSTLKKGYSQTFHRFRFNRLNARLCFLFFLNETCGSSSL